MSAHAAPWIDQQEDSTTLGIQFPSLGMLDLYETFHESGVFIFRLT
eukprot:COSAG01_NODE_58_length_30193_cov_12.302020_19_plen_46_part_00